MAADRVRPHRHGEVDHPLRPAEAFLAHVVVGVGQHIEKIADPSGRHAHDVEAVSIDDVHRVLEVTAAVPDHVLAEDGLHVIGEVLQVLQARRDDRADPFAGIAEAAP